MNNEFTRRQNLLLARMLNDPHSITRKMLAKERILIGRKNGNRFGRRKLMSRMVSAAMDSGVVAF